MTIDIPQLVHDAAVKYHINPKVIIATMQKEQSAITHCPEPWRLKLLMGAGSPTTAREQIDFGTSLFRAYMDEIDNNGQTRSGWKVGVAKTTEDGVSVTPATAAVASQFTYTPYAGANWGGQQCECGGRVAFLGRLVQHISLRSTTPYTASATDAGMPCPFLFPTGFPLA